MDMGLSSTVTFGQDQQSNIFAICESKATWIIHLEAIYWGKGYKLYLHGMAEVQEKLRMVSSGFRNLYVHRMTSLSQIQ